MRRTIDAMPEILFHERLAPLNETTHARLRLLPLRGYDFAARVNSVPLLAQEFSEAAKEYPIVFVRGSDEVFLPAALLGLRDRENLFVEANGRWNARYLPAFVRRYPFIPADSPDGQPVVCIDEAAACLAEKGGQPLFEDGRPAKALEHAIAFLRDFHAGVQATTAACGRLAELGLFRPADTLVELPDGSHFRLHGAHVINEEKLKGLDRDVIHELFSRGLLGMIDAQVLSLGNLARLVDRLSARRVGANR